MVVAVRCPNPKCRKYMLVEDDDRGKVVDCLICKKPIGVPADPAAVSSTRRPSPPKRHEPG